MVSVMPDDRGGILRALRVDSRSIGPFLFLMLLLAVDCAFILVHLLSNSHELDQPLLSLESDRSYSEYFQYLKEFSIAVLLLALLKRSRAIGYGVWALLFLYFLFDDSLKIHEILGNYVANKLAYSAAIGLRAQDFGEITVTATVAAFFLAALILAYSRGSARFRKTSAQLGLLVLALGFFGVFVDMLHVAVGGWSYYAFVGTFEDGGELVVMSLIAGYVYSLIVLERHHHAPQRFD